MLAKTSWFKGRRAREKEQGEDECIGSMNSRKKDSSSGQTNHGSSKGKEKTNPDPPTISVMFVDQTVGGTLARLLQETEDRLAKITGYRVRITETSGSQLCRILPNTNP